MSSSNEEKMSKKAAKKRAAKLEKLSRKQEREEATSSSLPLPLEEEDESFSSNYGDVTPKSAAGRSWREAVEGKELTEVSNLVEEIVGSEVSIRGRVHDHRLVGKKLFVILRQSEFRVQCVVEEARVGTSMLKFVKQLSHESVVELIGVVSLPKKPLTGTTQQVEIHVTKMYCLSRSSLNLPLLVEDAARSEADIEKSVKVGKPAARVLQDTRFNNRFLDLRTPANQGLFRIQCHVQIARVGTSMLKFVKQLSHESVVELIGVVSLPKKPLTGTTQQVEIHVTKMYCFSRSSLNLPLLVEDAARSEADIEKSVKVGKPAARVLQDTRFNNRFLDLRTPANQGLFRIQCHVQIAFREFLLSKGFLEIHTPKLIAGSSEGGSAVFRAEDSFTHRHLCEFVGLDVEMEIRMHYSEIMDLVGDLFPFIFTKIKERCPKELETVRKQYPFQSLKFLPQTLRLTFAQGIQMLKEAGEEVDPLGDLNTESEKKLGQLVLEKYKTEFYMLHRYPSAVRPFYTMPCEDDSNYSNSFDVFIRGEEIMSGAQRIHDPELLEKRARECGIDVKTISTYIDAFRYGAPPHGGFGVGLERVVMLLCALDNIRKTSLFPRDSQRLAP
ncbi:hypothetical protein F2Q68_00029293 [Brassica cretica]|uniref:aspartate--tRNA ligase n=1 Tax=Brassica cretica TaxID=69181 RepID=A0A8S9G2D0_BRACR|nr:hypothetical protein F2Q68_00029293 [Brassica cretica]